jgi:hypothetical protein
MRALMPTAFRSQLASLADSFANSVLDVVRSTSLEELLSGANGRASRSRESTAADKPARRTSTGRLKRRSGADIEKVLGNVVELVKRHKDGMRAEQIRSQLRMQSKEMPRVLAEGLASRKLKKKGQKRATTYFAA